MSRRPRETKNPSAAFCQSLLLESTGCRQAKRSGQQFKQGPYEHALVGAIKQRFIEARDTDSPYDLTAEMAVCRALLADKLARAGDSLSVSDLQAINALMNTISTTVDRVIRARNQTAITKVELKAVTAGMQSLLDEFLPDPVKRQAFLARLRAIMPGSTMAE